ncbi:hypothetical protein NFI96_011832, partial [Prochilodus magdalenae]
KSQFIIKNVLTVAYRRGRSIRELYEERVKRKSMQAPYHRMGTGVDRRPPFNWTEDNYGRGPDCGYGRGGGGYHGDDPRGHFGERAPYSGEKRAGPPYRREDPYFYYRGVAKEPPAARQAALRLSLMRALLKSLGNGRASAFIWQELLTHSSHMRNSSRAPSHPKGQWLPPPRPLVTISCRGDSNVKNGSMNLDRGDARESVQQKASFTPPREQSSPKREVPSASHSRSSRSSSPECSKPSFSQPPPKKTAIQQEKESPPKCLPEESQDGSPHSSVSATVQEKRSVEAEVEQGEETEVKEDEQTPEARRTHAITNKALEIEKLYRQDCETFGMVVKMLVAKQPTLGEQLETALKENLTEIKERCLEDLRHFISEVNVVTKSDQS